MIVILFISLLGILFYTYLGYPLVLLIGDIIRKLLIPPQVIIQPLIFPPVSIVVIAYNEEKTLEKKILNCLSLTYPAKKQIIFVSDASTDRTSGLLKKYEKNLQYIILPERKGKVGAMNEAFPLCQGEIIFFTDATTLLAKEALTSLIPHFANPKIGGVCGAIRFYSLPDKAEAYYWRYETWIRKKEAALSLLSIFSGALYAIRKKYLSPLPLWVSDDDFMALCIVAAGDKIDYEPTPLAFESETSEIEMKYINRVRSVHRAMATLVRFPFKKLTLPYLRLIFSALPHRFLKWTTGFMLILLYTLNIFLTRDSFLRWFFLLQSFVLLVYLMLLIFPDIREKNSFFRMIYYIGRMLWAGMVGMLLGLKKQKSLFWTPQR